MTTLAIVLALLFGLALGSFWNVCISRLPRHQSVVHPRSRCPHCQAPIVAYDNIPLLSFALLRRRCRSCRQPISWRYPAVEASSAALTVACILLNGLSIDGIAFALLGGLLLAMAVCDAQTLRLPDTLTLTTLLLGLLFRVAHELIRLWPLGAFRASQAAGVLTLRGVASAVAVAAGLLALRWFYWLLRRQQGMGLGDVKLGAALAAWLGLRQTGLAIFVAVLTGSLVGILMASARRGNQPTDGGRQAVPFGSFLCVAGIYCVFFGQATLRWYLHFFP